MNGKKYSSFVVLAKNLVKPHHDCNEVRLKVSGKLVPFLINDLVFDTAQRSEKIAIPINETQYTIFGAALGAPVRDFSPEC